MEQIEKRGDKNYRIKVFRGRDESGKRMFVTETVRGTLKQAKEHAARLQVQMDTGTYQEPVNLTLSNYLDRWLETAAKPKLRERSFLDYQSLLKRYVRDRIGPKMLTDLRPLDVQKVYSEMGEQGLSPRIIRYTHAVLSSALKQAVRWDMIQRNPCDQVSLPKQSRR